MHTVNLSNVEESEGKYENRVYKRRSLIFQSRVVPFDEGEGTVDDGDPKSKDAECRGACAPEPADEEERFNMREYIMRLRDERKIWQHTLKRRRTERKSLAGQKSKVEHIGQVVDLSVLSDRERAFLTARPNYEQICRNNEKLLEVASKISLLNQRVYNLNERIISRMEERLRVVKKRVIENTK